MIESRDWFDAMTAILWFGLAALGVVRRIQRLIRLSHIRLVEPVDARDEDYLQSVRRSTYLRLGTKFVLLTGSLIALFHWPLFEVWRGGVILMLLFMNAETSSVDRVRERLGKAATS